jgi:hypothetical protein
MSSGNENRTSILPTVDPKIEEPSFAVPGYDFQAALPTPASIGVRRDNTMGSVTDAARGVAYYADVIGFGQSSSALTRGMDFKPLGINYFLKTGIKCPNNEDMYMYIEAIPKGDMVGKYVQNALKEVGFPELRGLAPGMIEDVKAGLDPTDIFRAAFGDSFPKCVYVEKPVGDAAGRIENPDGSVYIAGPTYKKDGLTYQRRWVQERDRNGSPIFLTKAEYEAEAEKALNTFRSSATVEKFTTGAERHTSLVLGLLFIAAAYYVRKH